MTYGDLLALIHDTVDDFESEELGDNSRDDDLEEDPASIFERLVVKLRKEIEDVSD